MHKHKLLAVTIFLCLIFIFRISFALEDSLLGPLKKEDRILILAPHPDDESIGTAGLIQEALKTGAEVKVVCYTNGDNNELAFIVYEKRITFKKKEFTHMGEVRRKETIQALGFLGLGPQDIVFLGYPDFGTMEILTKYWGDTKPFRSMFARETKVPYSEALSFNAPYVGESILGDLKKIIMDFKPTKIFVSHPADKNRDHRSLYLFLQVALWDLVNQVTPPEVFPYIIHVVGWPEPRGYHPDLELNPPEKLSNNEILWQKLELTPEERETKQKAISFYRSQIEYDPPYLFTFARKNELFSDYPIVRIKRQTKDEISWQDLGISDKITPTGNTGQAEQLSALAYAIQDNNLFVRLILRRKIDKVFGATIFLLGYNEGIDFAKMPKINLTAGIGGLHVKDKKQTLFIKDVQLLYKNEALLFKIPLSVLGNPDYILSCARTNTNDLPLDETAWRILHLE